MKSISITSLKNKKVILGPWYGELGWEIIYWRGVVGFLSNFLGNNLIVLSFKGHSGLYPKQKFISHDFNFSNAHFGSKSQHNIEKDIIEKMNLENTVFIKPSYFSNSKTTLIKNLLFKFKFLKFHSLKNLNIKKKNKIGFHFRLLNRHDDMNKNMDINKIEEYLRFFSKRYPFYEIELFGKKNFSYISKNYNFKNFNDLNDTIQYINELKYVIGPSSGPMHLAQHCEVPILTWIGNGVSPERYLSWANPFNTNVKIHDEDSFSPDIGKLINTTIDYLG